MANQKQPQKQQPVPINELKGSITIDVQVAISAIGLIDVVTSRGAIRGEELLAVGATRQRLEEAVRPLLPTAEGTASNG